MYIHLNRQILYYEKSGKGAPLLLLHGNGEDHTIFDKLVPLLEQSYTVYAIDSRGHGESNPTDDFHYDGMADDIAKLITALELERPILFGFSDGAIIGLLIAIQQPGLLSKLILAGANLNPKGMKWHIRRKIKKHYRKTGSLLDRMMLTEPNIAPAMLSTISTPVLVLAGSNDMITASHTKKIAASLPHAQLQIISGEDHGSYIIHSSKAYQYIKGFLYQ